MTVLRVLALFRLADWFFRSLITKVNLKINKRYDNFLTRMHAVPDNDNVYTIIKL